MPEDQNRYVVQDAFPCIVTFRYLVDAADAAEATEKFTQDDWISELKPEIGDSVDEAGQGTIEAVPYNGEDEPPQEPMACPRCGSERVHTERPEQTQNALFRPETCLDCNASWTCEFTFTRYQMDDAS